MVYKVINSFNPEVEVISPMYGKAVDQLSQTSTDLVESNLKFALYQAHKYRNCGKSFEDILSAANFGLVKAAEKFDPSKEIKFISYAVHWINKYIKECLSERIIQPPGSHRSKLRKIKNAISNQKEIMDSVEITLNMEEIAGQCELTTKQVSRVLKNVVNDSIVQMDMPIEPGSSTTLESALEDPMACLPDQAMIASEGHQILQDLLSKLDEDSRNILIYHEIDGLNLCKVSKMMNMNYMKCRNMYIQAMDQLKEFAKGYQL